MHDNYREHVNRFYEAVREIDGLFQAIDVRVLAIRIKSGWHNLLTTCRLESLDVASVPRVQGLPQTAVIQAWQLVRPFRELGGLLQDLSEGVIRVNRIHVACTEQDEQLALSSQPYSSAYASLAVVLHSASVIHQPQTYVAHHLQIRPGRSGQRLPNMVEGGSEGIRHLLGSQEQPWTSLKHVSTVALLSGADPEQVGPQVDIIAPLGVALDSAATRLADGVLRIGLWAASSPVASALTVGHITESEDRSYTSGSTSVAAWRWKGRSDKRGILDIRVGNDAKRATVILRLGNYVVESRDFLDQTRPTSTQHLDLVTQRALDPDLLRLKEVLQTDERRAKKDNKASDRFEAAVARLFNVCGFHASAMGLAGVQDAVDVIALTPDGSVLLVIECTLGGLQTKEGKMGRVIARSAELRGAVADARTEIIMVFASARKRAALSPSELDAAAKDKVVVLAREQLLEVAELSLRGTASEAVLALLRSSLDRSAGLPLFRRR